MDNFNLQTYLASGQLHSEGKTLNEDLGIELPKVTSQKANAKITNAKQFAEFILDTWKTVSDEENESVTGLQDLKIAKEKLEKVAKMKDEPVSENARTDAEEEGYKDGMKDEKADLEEGFLDFLKKKKEAAPVKKEDPNPIIGVDYDGNYIRKDGTMAESTVTEDARTDAEQEGYKDGFDDAKDDVKDALSKMKVSELKAKIKETILAELTLAEADEEVDVDIDVEDKVEVEAGADDIEIERPGVKTTVDVGLSPEEEVVQDSLKAAMDAANELGNQKLADQIGNTITFFTREFVVGQNTD